MYNVLQSNEQELAEVYEEYHEDCCDSIERYDLKVVQQGTNYYTDSEIDNIFAYAIEHNRLETIKKILDYKEIPEVGMSIKQRLTYYQLLGND